jgi:hypothetical protein
MARARTVAVPRTPPLAGLSLVGDDPAALLTCEAIEPLIRRFLDDHRFAVKRIDTQPVSLGTSEAKHYSVAVFDTEGGPPLEFLLKVNRNGNSQEALFYARLASGVPVATPRVVAVNVESEPTWVLLEKVPHKPPHTFTPEELLGAVREIARLHAHYWFDELPDADWIDRMTPERLTEIAGELSKNLDEIAAGRRATPSPMLSARNHCG